MGQTGRGACRANPPWAGVYGPRMMKDPEKVHEYLAKAKEAADQAAKLPNGTPKESRLRICFAYRDMARTYGYKE